MKYVQGQLHFLEKLTYAKHLVAKVKKLIEGMEAQVSRVYVCAHAVWEIACMQACL